MDVHINPWGAMLYQAGFPHGAYPLKGLLGLLHRWSAKVGSPVATRGGYNSDDIPRVGVGGGGALSREAVMTELRLRFAPFSLYRYVCSQSWMNLQLRYHHKALCTVVFCVREGRLVQ